MPDYSNLCAVYPQYCGGAETMPYPQLPTMQPNQGALVYPKSTGTTSLDKILATSLSALALLTRQGAIPTTQQQQYGYNPYTAGYNPYEVPAQGYVPQSGNTLGDLENWVKNHTLATAVIAGAVLFYLLPSPRQSSRRNGLPLARNGRRRRTKKRSRRR